ncbi:PREDICTED: PIH1 domain-containing protein 1-like [Ceratosolen solmsi marchali]|uniref:PIH1 domain-containing protein 1-like n=1 Tax=Ceratosolen solmsi marchali TaxID=326594 RepID=A0AAJ6YLL2_9HYME|nr:PREDICTED: PIH1 domain-containing protein 1-like [Ceratosolen solmsi marchali]
MRKNYSEPCQSYKTVIPLPGACIKTWTNTGDKLFVNVCHSTEICAPKDICDMELLQEMAKEEITFLIPMAIGFERMSKDKDGIDRSTFDILINTRFFEKCMGRPCFWKFTVLVLLNAIKEKYGKLIDPSKYVVLKNCKVMGALDKFNIADREARMPSNKKPLLKKPLIEVLDEHITDNIEYKQKPIKTKNIKEQNYVIVKSDNRKNLIGFFYLPSSNIEDIIIDLGENRIIIENQKNNTLIDIFIPYHIDNECSIANYDSNLNILKLILILNIL